MSSGDLIEGCLPVAVVTLFPQMFSALTECGVTSRALKNKSWQLKCVNPRDFTEDVHRTVDSRPYGGGPGMVMMAVPLSRAIECARQWVESQLGLTAGDQSGIKVVYLSPQGKSLVHERVMQLSRTVRGLVLVCGRYEGVDERVIEQYVDEELSIGDYVLSGGELPAMVLLDALVRQRPGVLNDEQSAQEDSFVTGLLDCPHYARPENYEGSVVPEVLLSGNHEKIRRWRLEQSLGRTWQRRPDLLSQRVLSKEETQLLGNFQEQCGQKTIKEF